jgi:hypothetical protein
MGQQQGVTAGLAQGAMAFAAMLRAVKAGQRHHNTQPS